MARDFSELARLWVETYGGDIARLPWARLVEIANQCINAGIVHSMDPVRTEEGMSLAIAVEIALEDDAHEKAKADTYMPKLIGTDKQILWAEQIRRDAIAAARMLRQRLMRQMDELTVTRLDAYVTSALRKESKAKWFIDNRNDFADFPMIIKGKARNTPPEKPVPTSEAEEKARAEMTLRPKADRRMGVVEISASVKGLLAVITCDLDFMKIIQKHRLNWDPEVLGWRRKNDEHLEPISDQIASLAQALLAEGFAVMVSDEEARRKVQECINESSNSAESEK